MPILETRKIYAAGRSLAITLPRGWLAYFGIRAGDTVQIMVAGDSTGDDITITDISILIR